MVVEIVPALALVLGLYLWYQVDKEKKTRAKIMYTLAGLVASVWAIVMLFGSYNIRISFEPLVFSACMVGTIFTTGSKQAVLGAISLLIFLSIVL